MEITKSVASRKRPLLSSVAQLKINYNQCAEDPDANASICFHGCSSLIAQFENDYSKAIKEREIESLLIERIYELEEESPTDGWMLQDYLEPDIQQRSEILKQLKQKAHNQLMDPTWTTPVLKAKFVSQAGHE